MTGRSQTAVKHEKREGRKVIVLTARRVSSGEAETSERALFNAISRTARPGFGLVDTEYDVCSPGRPISREPVPNPLSVPCNSNPRRLGRDVRQPHTVLCTHRVDHIDRIDSIYGTVLQKHVV